MQIAELKSERTEILANMRAEITRLVETKLAAVRDGERGVRGPPGEPGAPGAPGEPGERGPEGEPGVSVKGDTGAPGERGPCGERGPAGPAGERGERGVRGFPGEPGATGETGASGLPGPTGTPGPQGPAGPAGAAGAAGPAGPSGPTGERGQEGPAGVPGAKGETGERGITGAPGKLPAVIPWGPDGVNYEGAVVTHEGATWQAIKDTGQAPGGTDWLCLAVAGRDGVSPVPLGTYRPTGVAYKALNIVAHNGGSFIAKRDDPGACPGDGWQSLTMPGKRGPQGEQGARGEKGAQGEQGIGLIDCRLDRANYELRFVLSDGEQIAVNVRGLFEQFFIETKNNG